MIYFKDFKLFKNFDDTGYILMNVNGSPDVECWINQDIKALVEPEGYCSCNVYIDISDLKEGINLITIKDNYECNITTQELEVVVSDKNTI